MAGSFFDMMFRRSIMLNKLLAAAAALCLALIPASTMAQSLDEIRQRGTLIIGLEGTYPPFNYQDEGGNLVGFEVDLAEALTAKLGLEPEFQPTRWDGLLAALQSGRIDAVINQVTVTEERQQNFAFTAPYTVSGIQIIATPATAAEIEGPDDLAGRPVGVVLGTTYEEWLRENVPEADIRTYDDDPTRNQDLRSGRIDAILNDRLVVANLLEQFQGQIVAVGEPFATQSQAIAVARGNDELVAALDQALAELREEGTLAEISNKWFGADVTQ
jgi:L-cystine transport system substrate-binding protein